MSKTVMQELIEFIQSSPRLKDDWTLNNKATELLHKEKEMVTNAYDAGLGDGLIGEDKLMKFKGNLDYYNKTYNHE